MFRAQPSLLELLSPSLDSASASKYYLFQSVVEGTMNIVGFPKLFSFIVPVKKDPPPPDPPPPSSPNCGKGKSGDKGKGKGCM